MCIVYRQRGDLLDVILVRETSKSTMIHSTTYYYKFGRPSYRGPHCMRHRLCARNRDPFAISLPYVKRCGIQRVQLEEDKRVVVGMKAWLHGHRAHRPARDEKGRT